MGLEEKIVLLLVVAAGVAFVARWWRLPYTVALVIAMIAILVNRPSTMGRHRAGILLNLGLLASFVFSCVMSYIALLEVIKLLRHGFA